MYTCTHRQHSPDPLVTSAWVSWTAWASWGAPPWRAWRPGCRCPSCTAPRGRKMRAPASWVDTGQQDFSPKLFCRGWMWGGWNVKLDWPDGREDLVVDEYVVAPGAGEAAGPAHAARGLLLLRAHALHAQLLHGASAHLHRQLLGLLRQRLLLAL